jgi:hypothetical protein
MGGLLLSTPALAQDDDAPYAYPDEEPAAQPEPSERPSRRPPAEDGEEEDDGDFERLSGMDDPNTGWAFEVIGGALLVDSSRGQLTETRGALGFRATWEYGRILDSETLREALWADVRYMYGSLSDGTELIATKTNLHYITLAPAYELKLGQSPFGFYAQAGGGVAYQATSLTVGDEVTPTSGIQPVLQYGVGFRGRPQPGRFAVAFRLEAMGFRRGYMNDFFLGGSLGFAF